LLFSCSVGDPVCISRIPDTDFFPSRIQNHQQKTGIFLKLLTFLIQKFHQAHINMRFGSGIRYPSKIDYSNGRIRGSPQQIATNQPLSLGIRVRSTYPSAISTRPLLRPETRMPTGSLHIHTIPFPSSQI
jgi:hypothetical protein